MARGGSAWPRTMLAAGLAASPIAVRLLARLARSIISRPAVACGSWRPGGQWRSLTWGLSPPRRDHAAVAVRAARGRPLLSCFSPIPATHPPLSGALPGTTSADGDRSQSVIMDAQPEAGQEYFDKCSLSCHLQFGFMLLPLSIRHGRSAGTPKKKGAPHFDTTHRQLCDRRAWALPQFKWRNDRRGPRRPPIRPRPRSSPWSRCGSRAPGRRRHPRPRAGPSTRLCPWVNIGRNFNASLRPSKLRSSSCLPWSPRICLQRPKRC